MVALEATTLTHLPEVSLEVRRDTLYARLESGYNTIEQAARAGEDVTRWEEGWQRLLSEYEYVCDQIAGRGQERRTA